MMQTYTFEITSDALVRDVRTKERQGWSVRLIVPSGVARGVGMRFFVTLAKEEDQ